MRNFIQEGRVLTLPAPYDRTSGQGALVGAIFGVATGDVASGAEGEFIVEGVYDLAKNGAEAWAVGDAIFWDDTAKVATTSDGTGANTRIGVAVAAAGSGASTGRVRLNGSF